MSWLALIAGAPVWIALCSGIDTGGGPVEGAIVGAGFWLLIAAGRFWLEWGDGYGNVGALRKRLASTTDASGVLQEEPPSPSVEAHPEPRKEQRDV